MRDLSLEVETLEEPLHVSSPLVIKVRVDQIFRDYNASLAKAESSAKNWEREIEDRATRVIRAEKERDEAKQEAIVAQLVAVEYTIEQ